MARSGKRRARLATGISFLALTPSQDARRARGPISSDCQVRAALKSAASADGSQRDLDRWTGARYSPQQRVPHHNAGAACKSRTCRANSPSARQWRMASTKNSTLPHLPLRITETASQSHFMLYHHQIWINEPMTSFAATEIHRVS